MKPERRQLTFLLIAVVNLLLFGETLPAADPQPPSPAKAAKRAFHWISPRPRTDVPGLRHRVFDSPSNGVQVGYYVYLPPSYDDPQNTKRRYPVVYALHGGRPGSEDAYFSSMPFVSEAMTSGKISPMIYVFPNGGEVSHYDYPKLKSFGETAFIKELIPLIDRTYRTMASRDGRSLEGFSQGGRATARYLFKYPELFGSGAPMAGGHQYEKHVDENNGDEGMYQFEPHNNTYELARRYALDRKYPLRIFIAVGDKDRNYRPNLEWMEHLRSLKIPFEQRIVAGVPHSQKMVYRQAGSEFMQFHATRFTASK